MHSLQTENVTIAPNEKAMTKLMAKMIINLVLKHVSLPCTANAVSGCAMMCGWSCTMVAHISGARRLRTIVRRVQESACFPQNGNTKKLQQFQFNAKKISFCTFGPWYCLCSLGEVTIPPSLGELQGGGASAYC